MEGESQERKEGGRKQGMITKREEGMRYADKQEGMEGEEQITRREIKEGKEDEQKTRKKKRKEEGKKSKQPGDNQRRR